ncbi:hypothetical protein [Streptomyces sp. CG 926]|uniref:hypothetical protein n=1 Tax=Streptomyces sp. CG 926 TaxID=1882405 RepID=UPI0035C12580
MRSSVQDGCRGAALSSRDSDPDGHRYETVRTVPFGKEVRLPDPVGITLPTEPLKDWVR